MSARHGAGPVGALERSKEDEARGDLGLARERLASYLVTRGYDATLLARLGWLCLRMGDLREAGRFFFFSDAEGAEVETAVDAFVRQHQGHRSVVLAQLPAYARPPLDQVSLAARARFERLRVVLPDPARSRGRSQTTPNQSAKGVGCLVLAGILAGLIVVGFGTVLRWVLPG